MKKYESPVAELIELNKNDIVATSGETAWYKLEGFETEDEYYDFFGSLQG